MIAKIFTHEVIGVLLAFAASALTATAIIAIEQDIRKSERARMRARG